MSSTLQFSKLQTARRAYGIACFNRSKQTLVIADQNCPLVLNEYAANSHAHWLSNTYQDMAFKAVPLPFTGNGQDIL